MVQNVPVENRHPRDILLGQLEVLLQLSKFRLFDLNDRLSCVFMETCWEGNAKVDAKAVSWWHLRRHASRLTSRECEWNEQDIESLLLLLASIIELSGRPFGDNVWRDGIDKVTRAIWYFECDLQKLPGHDSITALEAPTVAQSFFDEFMRLLELAGVAECRPVPNEPDKEVLEWAAICGFGYLLARAYEHREDKTSKLAGIGESVAKAVACFG